MLVDDVMTHEPVCCRSHDSLARAAQLMWDYDCGCVPVVDKDEHLIGIVTDRDVAMAALHTGRPLHELVVVQAMAKDPVTVHPLQPVNEAQAIMRRVRVRRLPVIDARGRLVGLLSLHDLARTATRERRWFTGVKLSDVARTFAEVSRPWSKPAPPSPRPNIAYAE
jgi:CBS domain-containing protein